MYGAIIEFEIKANRIDEFKNIWESAVAKAKKEGLVSPFLLVEAQSGRCRHIGFWRTAEGAKSWPSTQSYKDFLVSVQELVLSPPRRDVCEVMGDILGILEQKNAA